MPLRCIIVEDEPLAAEILGDYIAQTPLLELTHVCHDALQALDVVRNHPVDVIFLDIQLPKLNGLEFLKTLRHPPKVIITSAYHEFAVEGFDLRVTDFLLKPIEFSRFTKAVNKLFPSGNRSAAEPAGSAATPASSGTAAGKSAHAPVSPAKSVRPYYFFTVNKRSVKIYLDEILFIESLKDSVTVHTPTKSYQTHYQLGELEEMIRSDNFLRIHRSFLVAVDKIESYSAAEVEIAGRTLPIGRSHKNYVMERLGRIS